MPMHPARFPLIAPADPVAQAAQAPVLARLARSGAYHRQEEGESRLAAVSLVIAAAALPVAVVAVLLTRAGQLSPLNGVLVLCGAIVLSSAALAVGVVAAFEIWRGGVRGIGRLVQAGALAALVLVYPAYLAIKAVTLPVLAEVSTDLADPPVFSTQARTIAARGGIRPGEARRSERLAQVMAWPRLKSLTLDMEGEEAFSTMLEAVKGLKWTITEETRPDDSRGRGRIEAVVYSRLMRLPQDVTIRFRAVAGGTRVDIRARSRFGRHDFGANAALIQRLLEEVAAPVE
ncbi:MAG: DUF1499 domain-containing protein [Proteobacteria bacterium]|nr:DUF1499 domain-containing protein [Pseudomonadota bacterium]